MFSSSSPAPVLFTCGSQLFITSCFSLRRSVLSAVEPVSYCVTSIQNKQTNKEHKRCLVYCSQKTSNDFLSEVAVSRKRLKKLHVHLATPKCSFHLLIRKSKLLTIRTRHHIHQAHCVLPHSPSPPPPATVSVAQTAQMALCSSRTRCN
jgi:hypothetical protein